MNERRPETTIPLQCPGDLDQEEIDSLLSRASPIETNPETTFSELGKDWRFVHRDVAVKHLPNGCINLAVREANAWNVVQIGTATAADLAREIKLTE